MNIDKVTPHIEAMNVSDKKATVEAKVLRDVRACPGSTSGELAAQLRYTELKVKAALNKLKREGQVVKGTKRFCNATTNHVPIWKAV